MSQREINIATISGLIDALENPNIMVRAATLQAIAQYPEKASSLAEKGNVNLFRELVKLRDRPTEAGIRISYVQALLSLEDEQVSGMAKDEFLATDNTDIILLTAGKLGMLPPDERIAFLGPVVMAAADPTKSRVAANLLVHCRNLPVGLALRVAVASDHAVETAPLNDDNLHEWLAELQGPYPRRTRKILLAKEDGSFAALLSNWDKLPDQIRLWAFQETIKNDPEKSGALIWKILRETTSGELLPAALEAAIHLSRDEADEKMITAFTMHKDPVIRAAAIKVASSAIDWAHLLQNEPSDMVRVAIIERTGQNRHIENIELLASLLEDTNWRIRAAATNAMAALAPDSIPVLQRLLLNDNPAVRAAAVHALKWSGQED